MKTKKKTHGKTSAKKPVYRVLATTKRPTKKSLVRIFKELHFEEHSPHAISIPKTPKNIEKLWRLGFPV